MSIDLDKLHALRDQRESLEPCDPAISDAAMLIAERCRMRVSEHRVTLTWEEWHILLLQFRDEIARALRHSLCERPEFPNRRTINPQAVYNDRSRGD